MNETESPDQKLQQEKSAFEDDEEEAVIDRSDVAEFIAKPSQ